MYVHAKTCLQITDTRFLVHTLLVIHTPSPSCPTTYAYKNKNETRCVEKFFFRKKERQTWMTEKKGMNKRMTNKGRFCFFLSVVNITQSVPNSSENWHPESFGASVETVADLTSHYWSEQPTGHPTFKLDLSTRDKTQGHVGRFSNDVRASGLSRWLMTQRARVFKTMAPATDTAPIPLMRALRPADSLTSDLICTQPRSVKSRGQVTSTCAISAGHLPHWRGDDDF